MVEIPLAHSNKRKGSTVPSTNEKRSSSNYHEILDIENGVVVSIRLGSKQKSVVYNGDENTVDLLNFLCLNRGSPFVCKSSYKKISLLVRVESHVSLYQMLMERLPYEYTNALLTIQLKYTSILSVLSRNKIKSVFIGHSIRIIDPLNLATVCLFFL